MTIRYISAVLAAAFILTPALAAAQTPAASPAAAVPASPASPAAVDPKIEALAKSLLHGAQTNTLDRTLMTEQMSAQMTPDLLKNVATQLTTLGDYTSFTYGGSQMQDGLTVYQFVVAFKSITLSEYIAITPEGKIAGLKFSK
jgi:hypothetical protein